MSSRNKVISSSSDRSCRPVARIVLVFDVKGLENTLTLDRPLAEILVPRTKTIPVRTAETAFACTVRLEKTTFIFDGVITTRAATVGLYGKEASLVQLLRCVGVY